MELLYFPLGLLFPLPNSQHPLLLVLQIEFLDLLDLLLVLLGGLLEVHAVVLLHDGH